MSLQFIIGSSGAGKSYFAYERVIRESMEHPERNYYIIVPEQFTMQTQKTLVEMHPGKGILNIDILSFERLAYRVFEETGGDNRKVLEDTGKSMVLQKMVQQHRKELAYLGSQMNKPGYLDEVKSLVSEFMQYDIREENLAEMKEKAKDQPLLEMKLKDVGIMAYPLEYMEPKLPGLGDTVTTPDGLTGTVHSVNVLRQRVKVIVEINDEKEIQEFPVDDLKFRPRKKKVKVSEKELKELGNLEDKKGDSKLND